MSKEQVKLLIKSLAKSKGMYQRLNRSLDEAEINGDDTSEFYKQFTDCKDDIDVILKIES